uniref:G-protein coupled receptors family 1 profile domain-containing protein n=1 Tax=Timema shepardi TaxID=629360 RepID=A0A7R9B6V1_TIMSH|nr:unnamed protein product [Timema shepardi]
MCAANKVFMGTLYHYSTWLVVALTWARLFTIKYPLSLGWCSDRVAIYVVTALGVAFITLSGFEQDSVFEYEPCQINVSVSRGTSMNSAVFVYLTLSLWLPLTLILMGNLCLLTVVRRSVKTRSTLTAIRKKSLPPLDTFKLTRMLSLVSSAYLILLLPLGVAATLEIYWDVVIKKSPALEGPARLIYLNWLKRKLLFKWIRGLCYFVYLFHFCINFFLYCISGQKFRRVVIHHIRGVLPRGMSQFFCRGDARTSGSTPSTLPKKADCRPSPTNSGPSSQTVAHPDSSSHPSKWGYVNEAFTLKECVSPL